MALYYLPVLIRSDRYFVARLERRLPPGGIQITPDETDFNFVVHAEDRVLTPLLTIEDPGKIVLNQMAPSERQDIPLRECHISLKRNEDNFELIIKKNSTFVVEPFQDEETGLRLDYSAEQKRVSVGFYKYRVDQAAFQLKLTFLHSEEEKYSGALQFTIVRSKECQRVVIDFGSEASQVGYKNCGPQSAIVQYDILENIISQLNMTDAGKNWKREDFLNQEAGQPMLFRSFYAVRKKITREERRTFPFNFTNELLDDEIRLFITRQEVAATEFTFR
ncbi:MAG: hypothetical protein ABI688_07380, partial [Bacteroidota bacterium]